MQPMIEITDGSVTNRSGTSQRTGKQYSINEQTGYLHKPGSPYPDKIKISLGNDQPPYPAGNYDLHTDSFYVDKFGGLAVRPVLSPRPAEMKTDQQRKTA